MKVANFNPILIELLVKAGNGEVIEHQLPALKDVYHIRHRLYSLRKAMRAENHPLADAAQQTTVKVIKSPPTLRLEPADFSFASLLESQGFASPPSAASPASGDATLADIIGDTTDDTD